MLIDYRGKVFEDGSKRSMNDLAKATNGSETHSLEQLFNQDQVVLAGFAGGPSSQDVHKLLRTDPARNTLSAGFIAEEPG